MVYKMIEIAPITSVDTVGVRYLGLIWRTTRAATCSSHRQRRARGNKIVVWVDAAAGSAP
jgi:hypothetical protein